MSIWYQYVVNVNLEIGYQQWHVNVNIDQIWT
jgi:hypothetical protein